MDKKTLAPIGGGKEGNSELNDIIDNLKQATDILQTARDFGLPIDDEGRTQCPAGHDDQFTLRIDSKSGTFRCLHPECNDQGDVITLTQRLLRTPFEHALKVLLSGNGDGVVHWIDSHVDEVTTYGAVRDCMNSAARLFAGQVNQVEDYLTSRGISSNTTQRFLIGGTAGKNTLKQHLLSRGHSENTIRLSGLLNQHGLDRFQHHVVIPIFLSGQVVDFYGRYLGDEPEHGKHWRLPTDRFILGRSLFNWDPSREEIILAEGIFDALSLIEHGYDNAVATCGTNGLGPQLLELSKVGKIWMCFDGDAAGRRQGLHRAYDLKNLGLEVKIVDLPSGQDPNEFFMTRDSEDFVEALNTALIPERWELANLPEDLSPTEQIESLKDLLSRVSRMSPAHRAALVKEIAKRTSLKEKDIQKHVRHLEEQDSDARSVILDMSQCESIQPALYFGSRDTLMTVPFLTQDPKSGRTDWEPWVVTSNRDCFPLRHDELRKRGYYCNNLITPTKPRYSQEVIQDFLAGKVRGNIVEAYLSIRMAFGEYLDFADQRTFDYLTVWTIGTHFFPIFNYYPYLHFTGTKEVGKSKAMRLMAQMCFNGIWSVSISDASQFRIITELMPTLFLDESENLNDKTHTERRALLLGGFEKGSTAIRSEKVGDNWRVREYDNFSPRVFGNIKGMEDVLASRTVQIAMQRSYDEQIKNTEPLITDQRFTDIRDRLFLTAMEYGPKVRDLYESSSRPSEVIFDGREWNLFRPIYAVACFTEKSALVDALVGFANDTYSKKMDILNDTSVENVVLRYLQECVTQSREYGSKELHGGLIEFIRTEGLNVGEIREDYFGTLLHHLHVYESKDRRTINGIRQTAYRLNPEKVRRVAENYHAKG